MTIGEATSEAKWNEARKAFVYARTLDVQIFAAKKALGELEREHKAALGRANMMLEEAIDSSPEIDNLR